MANILINNTHYNIIDTLVHAYGIDKWNSFCSEIVPIIKSKIDSGTWQEDSMIWLRGDISSQVKHTIIECVSWSMIHGDYYGIYCKTSL